MPISRSVTQTCVVVVVAVCSAADYQPSPEELKAVESVIVAHDAARDRFDFDALETFYSKDADIRTAFGGKISKQPVPDAEARKKRIQDAKDQNLARKRTVNQIRFLTRDIVLVDSSTEFTGNHPALPNTNVSLTALRKEQGHWKIVATRIALPFKPTPAAEPPKPKNPVAP